MVAFARLVNALLHARSVARRGRAPAERVAPRRDPGVLIHGRLDLAGPPDVAWQLAQAWPGAELHVAAGGHTGGAEMDRLLLEATDRFCVRR